MTAAEQGVLFEDLRYRFADMERAYLDGMEDLGQKVVELVYQSNYELPLDDLVAFIEAEIGATPPTPDPLDRFVTPPDLASTTVDAPLEVIA